MKTVNNIDWKNGKEVLIETASSLADVMGKGLNKGASAIYEALPSKEEASTIAIHALQASIKGVQFAFRKGDVLLGKASKALGNIPENESKEKSAEQIVEEFVLVCAEQPEVVVEQKALQEVDLKQNDAIPVPPQLPANEQINAVEKPKASFLEHIKAGRELKRVVAEENGDNKKSSFLDEIKNKGNSIQQNLKHVERVEKSSCSKGANSFQEMILAEMDKRRMNLEDSSLGDSNLGSSGWGRASNW